MYFLYLTKPTNFLTHSSTDGHLGYFHVLATVNSAVMTIGYMCLSILFSSEYMPTNGVAGSHGNFIPSFLKESPHCYP